MRIISPLPAVLAIAFTVGIACNSAEEPPIIDTYTGVATAANVIPPSATTTPRAVGYFNTATLAYSYSVTIAPTGTIDSIALYQVAAGAPLPDQATAIWCAGAAACAALSGTATLVAPATAASIRSSIRVYGTQLVFFTTTAQKAAGGAMRGTMYAALD